MKFSSAAPLRLPGITSRLMKGRSGPELPISRQSSTEAIAAFISSGCANVLASISIGSRGSAPVRRMRPRLFGRTRPANNAQQPADALNLSVMSDLRAAGLLAANDEPHDQRVAEHG